MGRRSRRYDEDDDDDYGDKLTAPPDFDGPIGSDRRKVTDPCCALLLVAAWEIFVAVGVYAHQNWNIERIVHPSE